MFFSFEASERSKSLLARALRPLSARNHCSSMLLFQFESTFEHASFSFESTFDHACFSFEIPFKIALLRTVHCFELYFVRLHRRRKAPYANLYIYIYIYTSVNPCITCTKQSGAEQKLMPIADEQGAALFERPFRAQETKAPHGCGLERHFSSMLQLQGRLGRHPSSILRLRDGSSGTRRAFCGSGADSSGTRRAFCGSGADSSGTFRVV